MIGDNVQVRNRVTYPLKVVKDGREYNIPVGDSWLRSDIVPYAKAQNPLLGTDDPTSPYFESLIGVIAPEGFEQRDDIDMIPQEVLDAQPKERLNRRLLDPVARQTVERNVMFPRGRVAQENPSEGMVDAGKFQ